MHTHTHTHTHIYILTELWTRGCLGGLFVMGRLGASTLSTFLSVFSPGVHVLKTAELISRVRRDRENSQFHAF
jgi:hypothetical protein